jgi:hypothetical protein
MGLLTMPGHYNKKGRKGGVNMKKGKYCS